MMDGLKILAAECTGYSTAILDCQEPQDILKLVVEIMTIGIGIVGAIGITIAGIQYITAGGNEEQTRKAKRRIFEIVIGLFAYVLIYAALTFLIPDFQPFN
ncbi:hypothetical protein IJJ37_00105 [Candidatus Saccharibacteria bacterium]|nr:hypothetical protein [Candidatus Saccharibacteria bacterium]